MTLKTKLITTISMFFLVVALLITGVWAVSSANVNIGGTISFNATNIYATITGSITGATTTPTLSPLNYSAKSTPTTTELNSWKQNLTFADATTPTIKWTVTIQNKSERALYVTLTDNISTLTNATKTLTFDNGSASGEKTIPAKTSKTYTMEIKVTDTNASASVEYDFDFMLRDASTDAPSWVEFKYDESAMTATIQAGTIVDTSITEAYIPAKVTKDGKEYDVVIGKGFILGSIFSGCKSLKKVIIAEGITSIGELAFFNSTSIEEIVIPNSVTSIEGYAFRSCTALTSITIPKGVESIGSFAFNSCTNLTEVNIKATSVPTGVANMFDNCSSSLVIYVPTASVSAYKSASVWSNFSNQIQGKNF